MRTNDDLVLPNGDRKACPDDRGKYAVLQLAPTRVVARDAISEHPSQTLGTSPGSEMGKSPSHPVERAEIQHPAAQAVIDQPFELVDLQPPGQIGDGPRDRKGRNPVNLAQIRSFQGSRSVHPHPRNTFSPLQRNRDFDPVHLKTCESRKS